MSSGAWKARPEGVFDKWCVVDSEGYIGGAVVIADDLSREEAALIANAHAMRDALSLMLDAALEGEMPSRVVRALAAEVLLASQGRKDAA